MAVNSAAFVATSRRHLIGEYGPKMKRCIRELGDDGIWWRPNSASNSVANLVLHTCGNARQWIVSGILGGEDVRDRDQEFAANDDLTAEELEETLTRNMSVLDQGLRDLEALAGVDPQLLSEPRTIQGLRVTVLEALYHVVEHAAQHTGQIIYIAKLRGAKDLEFWVVESGTARPNW